MHIPLSLVHHTPIFTVSLRFGLRLLEPVTRFAPALLAASAQRNRKLPL
jgi:hypothetical protein